MAGVKGMSLGENVTGEVDEKGILTLRIDLNYVGGRSKSGKSLTVATTGGNVAVPNAPGNKVIKLGINAYSPQ